MSLDILRSIVAIILSVKILVSCNLIFIKHNRTDLLKDDSCFNAARFHYVARREEAFTLRNSTIVSDGSVILMKATFTSYFDDCIYSFDFIFS